MILKRFYDDKLAQASYLVGCARTGESAVIDANRNVEQYIQTAVQEGLRITAVTETHIHADYVSGSRELADRTGAQLYLSDEGDADWKYGFASQPNVTLVKEGDKIRIGNVRLDVMKTPGHTPEHISFIHTDEPANPAPLGAFTGDFIFVGDVGRPDLLEKAAGVKGTMEKGAQTLFRSLDKFKSQFPNELIIWPAHGSGSACGKALGGVPMSTLGYEKVANWGLRFEQEEEFVNAVLEGQPEPPYYFREMKRINKVGPDILGGFKIPPQLGGPMIFDLLDKNAVIVDVRSAGDAATGFIPGVLNIPNGSSFTNWAGWLLPYDKPIYLIAETVDDVAQSVRDLQSIGLDDVSGWMGKDALRAYERRHGMLETVAQLNIRDAVEQHRLGEVELVDIRGAVEYGEGHIPRTRNIPLGYLRERACELPRDKRVVLMCSGGSRSPIGCSVLRNLGFLRIANQTGGFDEYLDAKLPIETGARALEALT